MTVITLIHGVFYRTGIAIQNLLGWIKIVLALFMTITGFAVVFYKGESALRMDDVWNDSDWRLSTIAAAFFKILYSFAGLENINNVMNEVKNPIRTIKTVGPAALITACIMYVLINIAYFVVVPLNEVKQSQELIAALFFERLGFGRIFLPIAIALSAAGNVMVVTFSLVRRFLIPSVANVSGSSQSRDCSTRISAILRSFRNNQTFWITSRRIDCALRPISTYYSFVTFGISLWSHR